MLKKVKRDRRHPYRRSMIKRLTGLILSLSIILGMLPVELLSRSNVVYAETDNIITRVQWVHELTELFEMTVEEDNYPDNYFSDISDEDEYYRDIMIAVEFGIVDIEAGQPFMPNEPVTRDFAAHTMNYCLGFQLEGEFTYTYTDYEASAYPEDAQIAINRSWFTLVDGKFNPEQSITSAEMKKIFDDASDMLSSTDIDYSYESEYEFTEDVKVFPDNTVIEKDDNNVITVANSPLDISEGDRFAVFFTDLPEVFEATKVTKSENLMTIETNIVDGSEVIENVEAQGITEGDLSQAIGVDGTTVTYIVGGTAERSYEDGIEYKDARLAGSRPLSAIKGSQEVKLGNGMKAKFEVVISSLSVDYKISSSNQEVYVVADGTSTMTCNVSVDALQAAGIPGSISLINIPVAGVGVFNVSAEYTLQGQVTFSYVADFSAGVQYTKSDGFRLVKSFRKKSFSVASEAKMSAGMNASLGVTSLPIVSGKIYAKAGVISKIKSNTYNDGKTPNHCTHFSSYLYASVGASCSVKFLFVKKSFSKSYDFYNESNSPVRVAFHYEDGRQVQYCTRNRYGYYYSSWGTRYGSNGMRDGYSGSGVLEVPTWTYDLIETENGTKYAKITGYNGNVGSLMIPETLDGYKVKEIGESVFANKASLYTVMIPDTVTTIGSWAFSNCSNLTNVKLSKSLEKIGGSAFDNCDALGSIEIPKSLKETTIVNGGFSGNWYGVFRNCDGLKNVTFEEGTTEVANGLFASCSGLEKITIPDTVITIENSAFYNCANLKEVKLSNLLTRLEDSAFSDCTVLKEIEIPDTVTSIGSWAFSNCSNLTTVKLSKSLEKIGGSAFDNCDALESIEIPKSLKETTIVNGGFSGNWYGVFRNCDGLKNVTFEEGTTEVANGLFGYCTGLEKITIPDTVIVIESNAFEQCRNLKEIKLSNSLACINESAFSVCTSLEKIDIPDSVTLLEKWAFSNCGKLSTVKLSKSLERIGGSAFDNCDALESIEIPKSLKETTIVNGGFSGNWYGVFRNCDGLKNVTFEEGTTEIANGLFGYCTGLEKITIPDTVITIEDKAFCFCTNLKEISIPDSVKKIGSGQFEGCTSLTLATIGDATTSIGGDTFRDCSKLKTVKLPVNYTQIERNMFYGCSSLEKIVLPSTITRICSSSFENSGLTELIIPDTVVQIDEYAFKGCEKLEKISFETGLKTINRSAFENTGLNALVLPEGLNSVDEAAFKGCKLLESVEFSDSIVTLGKNSFENCETLSTVKLGNGLTEIPSYTFNNCFALKEVVLPYRVQKVGDHAFTNCTALTTITIPRATSEIASDAFSYPTRMTAYGIAKTYAENYANEKGMKFVNKEVLAETVTLSQSEITLMNGTSTTVVLNVVPENFTDTVTWKSTDTNIITVNDMGVITPHNAGTAIIKVNVGSKTASCKVTVIQPVSSIRLLEEYEGGRWLSNMSVSFEALQTCQIYASISPTDANNKEIIWSSSNESVATVDQKGLVKTISKGEAVIMAKACDGSGVTGSCTFVVTNNGQQVTDISEMQCSHPYEDSSSDFWAYQLEGAENLKITFDSFTEIEEGFDYLYVYDKTGKTVGKYTGTELANQTISVPGDTVKVKLVSDDGGNAYGFKVVNIEAADTISPTAKPSETPDITPTQKPTDTPDPNGTEVPIVYVLGDVDADDSISATDALAVLKHAAKISVLNDKQLLASDTSKDGNIDASDALLILKYAAKIIDSF